MIRKGTEVSNSLYWLSIIALSSVWPMIVVASCAHFSNWSVGIMSGWMQFQLFAVTVFASVPRYRWVFWILISAVAIGWGALPLYSVEVVTGSAVIALGVWVALRCKVKKGTDDELTGYEMLFFLFVFAYLYVGGKSWLQGGNDLVVFSQIAPVVVFGFIVVAVLDWVFSVQQRRGMEMWIAMIGVSSVAVIQSLVGNREMLVGDFGVEGWEDNEILAVFLLSSSVIVSAIGKRLDSKLSKIVLYGWMRVSMVLIAVGVIYGIIMLFSSVGSGWIDKGIQIVVAVAAVIPYGVMIVRWRGSGSQWGKEVVLGLYVIAGTAGIVKFIGQECKEIMNIGMALLWMIGAICGLWYRRTKGNW